MQSARDLQQRNEVMVECYPMVERLANKAAATYGMPTGLEREDLVSSGMIGLAEAWERFDADRGIAFEAYALPRIRGAIVDAIREHDWVPRKARLKARETGGQLATLVSIEDNNSTDRPASDRIADECTEVPGLALETAEQRRELIWALNELPERERFIITQHYFEGVRLDVVAETFGVTPSRVSQLHSRALNLLRDAMERATSPAAA